MNSNGLTSWAAQAIHDAFAEYHDRFKEITRRATRRFEERDWVAAQCDASDRLSL